MARAGQRSMRDISERDIMVAMKDIKAAQDALPKRSIWINQPFGTDPNVTQYEWFSINGISYAIPYDKFCMVPENVFAAALHAKLVQPQTADDVVHLPVKDPRLMYFEIIDGTRTRDGAVAFA